jgi:cleavage stimulation factor subunit 3
MTARSVLQDLKKHLEPLRPVEIPPRPLRNEQDRALVVNWRKYLKWEESNPLDIEDAPVLQSRIGYAYRKCLTQMRFYPEMWYVAFPDDRERVLMPYYRYAAANFYQMQDKMDDMLAYIKTGLDANPSRLA